MSSDQDDSPKPRHRHNKWSTSEDNMLKSLVQSTKKLNWFEISRKMQNRNPRQCQERWEYYLSPFVNNSPWTPQEDALLLQKFKEFGSRWTVIARFFYNRTNTNVKNRFLAMVRNSNQLQQMKVLDEVSSPCDKVLFPNISDLDASLPQIYLDKFAMMDSLHFLSVLN